MSNREELAWDIFSIDNAAIPDKELRKDFPHEADYAFHIAEGLIEAGYRKVFDGDCGLSNIKDPDDREAAEAWMRFSNIVLGNDHDGIGAMKQMLTEFGYRKDTNKQHTNYAGWPNSGN